MKQTATQLIALIILSAFLLGAAVSYLACAEPSSSPQDSNSGASALATEKTTDIHVAPHAAAKENSRQPVPCPPPNGEFGRDCPENHADVGKATGPTPAFPTTLPPLTRGHTIEVGVELEQVVRQ